MRPYPALFICGKTARVRKKTTLHADVHDSPIGFCSVTDYRHKWIDDCIMDEDVNLAVLGNESSMSLLTSFSSPTLQSRTLAFPPLAVAFSATFSNFSF